VQETFAGAVAVRLVRKEDETRRRALALERGVEAFALDGKGAGVVVGFAVDEQERVFDFIGEIERRHGGVDCGGLPERAGLRLEAVGGERAVVSAAAGDAGAEEPRVGEEVGGHERAVAVAADRDAFRVGDAAAGEFVDGGLGVGDELVDVGVVRRFSLLADDGHGGIVEDGVTGEEEGEGALHAEAHEFFRGAAGGDLFGGRGGEKLAGVGPQQRRQRALVGRVAGREIERAGEADAVGALVADEFLFHAGELGIGVGERGDGRERAGLEGADKIVFGFGEGLALREGAGEGGVGEGDELLIGGRGRAPEAARLFGDEVVFVEERAVAVGRGAEAVEKNLGAVGAALEDEAAGGVAGGDGAAGVGVTVLRGALGEQFAFAAGRAGGDAPGAQEAGALPALGDEREGVVAPGDGGDAEFEALLLDRRAGERGGEGEPGVALAGGTGRGLGFLGGGGAAAGAGAFERLDPGERGGMVGAPGDLARAGADAAGAEFAGFIEREIGDAVFAAAGAVDDVDGPRETRRLDEIGKRTVQRLDEEVLAVGGGGDAGDEAADGERGELAVEREEGEFGGGVVFEQGFVVSVGQEILVGGGRGLFPEIFLHDGAGGHARGRGRRAAAGGHAEEREGVGVEPGERIVEDGVENRRGEAARLGGGGVGEPEFEAGGADEGEGEVARAGGPGVVGNTDTGRQTGDAPVGAAGDGFEEQAGEGEGAARGVDGGVEAEAGEAEFGLGEFGDGGSVGALEDQEGLAVGAHAHGGGGGRVDERGECGGR
jgi:hypothetical protein